MAIKSKKKKEIELEIKKTALRAEIVRRKLLQAIVSKQKRPVAILRRVEDKIPNVLIKRRDEEIKPAFIGRGRLI